MKIIAVALLVSLPSIATAETQAPSPDDGVTTEVHKANVGTIVFATSQSALTGENAEQFVTTAKVTDSVFLRAYLPHSLDNAFRAEGSGACRGMASTQWSLSLDGTDIVDEGTKFFTSSMKPAAVAKATSVTFDTAINVATEKASFGRSWTSLVAPLLTPGEHTVKIALRGSCIQTGGKLELATDLATGTLTLVVPKSYKAPSLLPKAARTDAKLQKEATELLEAEWQGDKVLKVVVVDKEWAKETRDTAVGPVVYRRVINTAVGVEQKSGCRVFEVRFEQASVGKTFGPTQRAGTGASKKVPCSALK